MIAPTTIPGHEVQLVGYARHHTGERSYLEFDVLVCARCGHTFFRTLGDVGSPGPMEDVECVPASAIGDDVGIAQAPRQDGALPGARRATPTTVVAEVL